MRMTYRELMERLEREGVRESTLNDFDIPSYMREPLLAYIVTGRGVGDFLTAILSNDLAEAVGHADATNEHLIPGYVRWLYNYAPTGCWGSPELVATWRQRGGLVRERVEAAS